jgi:uncharacterized protein
VATQTVAIRVKPNSGSSALEQDEKGNWVARVKAAPIDGKANAELVRLIAQHFGVPRAAVTIRSGSSARIKRIDIDRST